MLRRSLLILVAAFALAVVAVALDGVAAPTLPLYNSELCSDNPAERCHYPNMPRLPLLPLLGGAVYGVLAARAASRGVLPGLAVGAATSLVATLFVAAAIPLKEPYFITVYRAYGIVYLAGVLALGTFALIRGGMLRRRPLLWPLGFVPFVAISAAVLRGDHIIAAAGLTAVLAAGALAAALPPLRPRVPSARTAALLLAFAAFATRAAFGLLTLARGGDGVDFAIASDDGDSYYNIALGLARDWGRLGAVLSGLAFPPAYSIFLAAVLTLTRESLGAVVLVQALLAAGATFLVYLLGAALRDRATGLLAAAFVALDQNLIQNQSTLTAEALLVPAILLSLYALIRYRDTERAGWLVAAAAPLGLAFVTRNVAAIPLLLAALGWLVWWRRRRLRLLARDSAVLLAAILLASLPIAAATNARDGSPRLTTQLAGLAWVWDGGKGLTISNTILVQRGIVPFEDPLGSVARVVTDPLPVASFYASVAPQRLSTLLFFLAPGSTDPLLIADPLIYDNPFGDSVTLLRLVGLLVAFVAAVRARAWRTRPGITLLAAYGLLYLCAFSFVFPPYHPFRYRIPIEPIRFIAEAAGIVLLVRAALPLVLSRRLSARSAR